MGHKGTKIIACSTVINEIQPFLPSHMESIVLEAGLHLRPDTLRDTLQAMIDEITAHTETIILGYGLCSMGVIGLNAAHSTLVIPRQDDCIAIFLGSRTAYRKALDEEPGTYFLSKGWIDAGITLLDELKRMEESYGGPRAAKIMNRMLQNYRRLVFIHMGDQGEKRYRQFSRRAAKAFDLSYQEIKGTPELLKKLCNGPWDDEFLISPPGHTIHLEDFVIGVRS